MQFETASVQLAEIPWFQLMVLAVAFGSVLVAGYQQMETRANGFRSALGHHYPWRQVGRSLLSTRFVSDYKGHTLDASCTEERRRQLGNSDIIHYLVDLSIKPPSPYRYNLYVTRQGLLDKLSSSPEIEVGVPAFDRAIRLTGDHAPGIIAMMNDRVRELILALEGMGETFEIRASGIRVRLRGLETAYRLTIVLEHLRELSERLCQTGGIPDRLIDNVVNSKVKEFRRLNLQVLRRYELSATATLEAGRFLFNSIHLEEQATGAVLLGRPALEEFVSRLMASKLPTPRAVVEELAQSKDPLVLPFLNRALFYGPSAVPALEGLLRLGDLSFVPRARELVRSIQSLSLEDQNRLIDLLGACARPELEPALLERLRLVEDSNALLEPVLRALGRCGTAQSVMPLKPFADGLLPTETRRLAREAIAQIQTRLGPEGAGGLMLVQHGAQEGALTLVEASSHGGLSLAVSQPVPTSTVGTKSPEAVSPAPTSTQEPSRAQAQVQAQAKQSNLT